MPSVCCPSLFDRCQFRNFFKLLSYRHTPKILAFLLPAVARWDATFCSFRGIGEGGTAFSRESWSRGGGPCGPRYAGAPREHGKAMLGTRVTFVSRRKEPKACQGRCPWTPLGGRLKSGTLFSPIPPTAQAPFPPERVSGTNLDGFATFGLCGNWHFFLPKLHRGNTGCF